MEMSIDEAINRVKEHSCAICSYGSRMDECDISYCDVREAIAALTSFRIHYQKIQKIVEAWKADVDIDSYDSMADIREVVEDGND